MDEMPLLRGSPPLDRGQFGLDIQLVVFRAEGSKVRFQSVGFRAQGPRATGMDILRSFSGLLAAQIQVNRPENSRFPQCGEQAFDFGALRGVSRQAP